MDTSLTIDEFSELYITATTRLKADNTTKDGFWVGKFNVDGATLWNYRYGVLGGYTVNVAKRSHIDIFGDLNIAINKYQNTDGELTVDVVKLGYNGIIKSHTNNKFDVNNIEGLTAHTLFPDSSGDIHVYGQTSWNRNELLLPFTSGETTDTTGHYTPTFLGEGNSLKFDSTNGYAQILGKDTVTPTTWVNSAIQINGSDLGTKMTNDWTIEFMLYKDAVGNNNTHSQTQQTLIAIGDATLSTGGLWLYYDISSGELQLVVTANGTALNSASGALQSAVTTMFADNTWQFVALTKSAGQ